MLPVSLDCPLKETGKIRYTKHRANKKRNIHRNWQHRGTRHIKINVREY
jgi:hypothetical protein